MDRRKLPTNLSIRSSLIVSVNRVVTVPVPERKQHLIDHYNECRIQFKQPFSVLFRVYNNGIAYRILTRFKDSVFIKNETAEFNFSAGTNILAPIVRPRMNQDKYHTSFEETYTRRPMDSLGPEDPARELDVCLDFIEKGSYEASICKDGINADRFPSDYTLSTASIQQGDTLHIRMAPSGGYLLRLRKINHGLVNEVLFFNDATTMV